MANSLAKAQAAFDKAAADLQAQINKLQRFPSEYEVGTVLVFTKTYPDERAYQMGEDREREYTYAALRTDAGWFTTAQRNGQFNGHMTWADLVEAIGDSPCAVADGWTPVGGPVGVDDEAASAAKPVDPAKVRTKLVKTIEGARRSRRTPGFLADEILKSLGYGS
jgi:hypothetical protein